MSGRPSLTNDIIDARLLEKGSSAKRIGDYINNHTKIEFLCGCGNIWLTNIKLVFRGLNCPACSKVKKLTNDIVDQRLQDSSICRLDDIKNSKNKN